MKYHRRKQRDKINRIWDRWELEYFENLFLKLTERKKGNGSRVYINGEEAFWELNAAYKNVFGKERYSSYQSFLSSRYQKNKK